MASETRRFPHDKTEEHDFGPNKPRPIYRTKDGRHTTTPPLSVNLLSVAYSYGSRNNVILEFDRRLTPETLLISSKRSGTL